MSFCLFLQLFLEGKYRCKGVLVDRDVEGSVECKKRVSRL